MAAPLVTIPDRCASSVIMSLRRVVGMAGSPFTLEEQSYKYPGEQWAISFRLPPSVTREIASEWIAFGIKLQGTYGRFLMGDPMGKVPQGVATGTPLVNGGAQSGNTLVTDGWTTNVNGILKTGDYIQLGTGTSSRLHMVVENANSNAFGQATLNIEPALRTPPADNSAIIVNNAKGIFRLTDNNFSWSVDPGPVYRVSFEAVEVVNA